MVITINYSVKPRLAGRSSQWWCLVLCLDQDSFFSAAKMSLFTLRQCIAPVDVSLNVDIARPKYG